MKLITKEDLKKPEVLESLNKEAAYYYLKRAERYLSDSINICERLDRKAFILFSGYLTAGIALFGLSIDKSSFNIWYAMTATALLLGCFCLTISIWPRRYGNLGSNPEEFLRNTEWLTVASKYSALLYAELLINSMKHIELADKSNNSKSRWLRAGLVCGASAIAIFAAPFAIDLILFLWKA